MEVLLIRMLPKRFSESIERNIRVIINSELPVKDIILFGSCASGEIKSTSDVDLLIITEQKLDLNQRALLREMIDNCNCEVASDLVFYSSDIFKNSMDTFTKNIKKNGKFLYKGGELTDEYHKLLYHS